MLYYIVLIPITITEVKIVTFLKVMYSLDVIGISF